MEYRDPDYPMFQVCALPYKKRKNQVEGRSCGIDLPIGTIFTQATKIRFLNSGREEIKHEILEITQVKLYVEQIESYERFWSCLPRGYGGRLTLSGRGFEVFKFAPQNDEYINLEAPNFDSSLLSDLSSSKNSD